MDISVKHNSTMMTQTASTEHPEDIAGVTTLHRQWLRRGEEGIATLDSSAQPAEEYAVVDWTAPNCGRAMLQAFTEQGLFRLSNHGLEPEQLDGIQHEKNSICFGIDFLEIESIFDGSRIDFSKIKTKIEKIMQIQKYQILKLCE